MASYENIDIVLNKMRSSIQRNSIIENIAPLHISNEIEIHRTLELLNVTHDINLQIKLFSVLSACVLNKEEHFELIIKYSAVYDRVYNVLQKGLPRKAEHALNFLTTLLYVDAEDGRGLSKRRTLALYAKNKIRTSGCLGVMTDMFTNSMMFHDTWNALCQCLAASCSGSSLNQSYCSHLISVCIQRSNQTHIEIFLVLNSLLQNHNRNIELFLNSNGLSIFTRELLHYDKCLQVLITIAQFSAAHPILRQGQISKDLRGFLDLYGPNSQIGQSAKVILNHIEPRSRRSSPQCDNANENIPKIMKRNRYIDGSMQRYAHNKNVAVDDTAVLMKNIMREANNFNRDQFRVLNKTSKAQVNSIILSTSNIVNARRQRNNSINRNRSTMNKTKRQIGGNPQKDSLNCNNYSNLSFSFLNQHNTDFVTKTPNHMKTLDRSKKIKEKRGTIGTSADVDNNLPKLHATKCDSELTVNAKNFEPIFSSTPKREEFSHSINYSECSVRRTNVQSDSMERSREVVKSRTSQQFHNNDKSARNKTLSSRFFSAINQSCTTLVKTVANVFKKKEDPEFSRYEKETQASRAKNECSFSFINYMRKRDAFFDKLQKTRNNALTDFSMGTASCDTCDTQTLKKKMTKNNRLRQTVKKLKLGINLYGCDFKKISRTMWPRDPSMTPLVLYNLYRKLLLK